MFSVATSLAAVKQSITDVFGQMTKPELDFWVFDDLSVKFNALQRRKMLLESFPPETTERVGMINAEYDKKIRELESERAALLLEVQPPCDPIVDNIVVPAKNKMPPVDKLTVDFVRRYVSKYINNPVIRNERQFFRAAACSNESYYVSIPFSDSLTEIADELEFKAELPDDTRWPIVLSDVESIIHSEEYCFEWFLILDTSLRVILTNAGFSDQQCTNTKYVLIYDPKSFAKFAPIAVYNRKYEPICQQCFRYLPKDHVCELTCPICQRTGDDAKCRKVLSEQKLRICPTCNAYCYTAECFRAHQDVCSCPVSGLRDDILQLLQSLDLEF